MKYGLLFIGVFLAISTLAFAKSKSKQPPVDTASTTSAIPIPGVPKAVSKFFNQSDLEKLKKGGFKVYTGNTPPKLEGIFVFDTATVVYKSGNFPGDYPIGYQIESYDYTFSKQRPDRIDLEYISIKANDQGKGGGSYISGSGDCFTIYMDKEGTMNECRYKAPVLVSGCVASDGIKKYEGSYSLTWKTQSAYCNEAMMPVGYVRIYKEKDGLVARKHAGQDNGYHEVPLEEPAPEEE